MAVKSGMLGLKLFGLSLPVGRRVCRGKKPEDDQLLQKSKNICRVHPIEKYYER